MTAPRLLTMSDCLDALNDFAMSYGGAPSMTQQRRAILGALEDFQTAHNWQCLKKVFRVHLHAAQTTGTCAYTHSTLTITLTDATNPSWINDASILIDDDVCDVEAGTEGGTTFTLDATMNPGADIVAGASYTLFPRYYALPSDFGSMGMTMDKDDWQLGRLLPFDDIYQRLRYEHDTGEVEYYCVADVPDLYGTVGLFVYPIPTESDTVDFTGRRKLRQLRYSGKDSSVDYPGTVTVTAGSAAVTGSGTAFADEMEGAAFRIAGGTTHAPSGLEGQYPWIEERSIKAFTGATSITLDGNIVTSRTGVKYIISDPIDLPPHLHNAFLWCCRKHLAVDRNIKDWPAIERAYENYKELAKIADAPHRGRLVAGDRAIRAHRLSEGTIIPGST